MMVKCRPLEELWCQRPQLLKSNETKKKNKQKTHKSLVFFIQFKTAIEFNKARSVLVERLYLYSFATYLNEPVTD